MPFAARDRAQVSSHAMKTHWTSRKLLITECSPLTISPLSAEQPFELARSPRALADSVRSVRSAGLYVVGATSMCFLVGAFGAGAIFRLCHRCARVARGRGSRLAPLGHGPCAPSMWARVAVGHPTALPWPSVLRRPRRVACGNGGMAPPDEL